MLIESKNKDGNLVVSLFEKRLESSIASEFHHQVADELHSDTKLVILDFEHLEFIDSSGLGSVVAIKKAAAPDTVIKIVSGNRDVLSLFRLTKMDRVFEIYDDIQSALAA